MVANVRRWMTPKRVVVALIIANEIRGCFVAFPVAVALWKSLHL